MPVESKKVAAKKSASPASTVESAKSKKRRGPAGNAEKKAPPVVVDFTKAEGPPSIKSRKTSKGTNKKQAMDPNFVDNINAFLAAGFGTIDKTAPSMPTGRGTGQVKPKKRRASSKGRNVKTEAKL